jgi:hypothetical protein
MKSKRQIIAYLILTEGPSKTVRTSARSKNKCLLVVASGFPPQTLHLGFCEIIENMN